MTTKVASVDEVVATVPDGAHLALTGFAITRNNTLIAHALVRARQRDLILTQVIGGIETDLLAAGGCLARLRYSGGSMDRFGPLHGVNRAIATGEIEIAEYSSLALTLRLHAGALGLPFVAARSMLGSDLLAPLIATGEVRLGEDPTTGAPVVLLSPLNPDVAFVHADVADRRGNAVVSGPTWALRDTAFASRRVVVVCEELVTDGSIDPNRVTLPGAVVTAVVPALRSAHPTAVFGRYDYDREHLNAYAIAAREGRDAHDSYLDTFVRGVQGHAAYLELAGAS
jgi:acyl CoA:acetate/3-ketoacid CoA transferase alpha subunit